MATEPASTTPVRDYADGPCPGVGENYISSSSTAHTELARPAAIRQRPTVLRPVGDSGT
jgi:hypothetical protein